MSARMSDDMTILDGGMGQELVARMGHATTLWSVQALIDRSDLVRAVHDDFFTAGADVATTNTYSLLPDRLARHDLADRLDALTEAACTAAVAARDAAGGGLVAGALGPLGFSYRPDLAPGPDAAAEVYADLARLHARWVDVHLCETMASVGQAEGALRGAGITGKPVWLALTVMDDDGTRLRSGEPLSDALPLIARYRPARVLLNCARPEALSAGLPTLAGARLRFGAYANGFDRVTKDFARIGGIVDDLDARPDLDPDTYADFARRWRAMGASTIGGCCEIGPDHIRAVARALR